MFHSELCERSLLNSSASKRVDTSFRAGGEVQKVMKNVLKSSFTPSAAADVVVTTTKSMVNSPSKVAAGTPISVSKASVTTVSGFRVTSCIANPSTTTHLHNNDVVLSPSSKIRKRRISVTSPTANNSTAFITTTTPSTPGGGSGIPATSSASLLAVNESPTRNRVDVVLKSPTRETVSIAHLTNGMSGIKYSQISTPSTTSSNLTKTVTFSLGNQQNLNLVRLTPVSLRSNLEGQNPSSAITETEVKNLKALVLLHLDLVQQQQNIIAEKDKLIADLRTETNTLKIRLERMDRRLSVSKTSTRSKNPTTTDSHPTNSPQPSEKVVTSSTPSISKQSKAKPKSAPTQSITITKKGQFKRKRKVKARFSPLKHKVHKKKTDITPMAEIEDTEPSVEHVELKSRPDDLFRVNADYYTHQVEEFEELTEETIPNCQDTQAIEVPSYRTHTYSNSYSLEGTEDLDDQVFLKRHQKHESDEKKRKRWDLQRQREQQMREKLQQHHLTPAQKLVAAVREKQLEHIFPCAEKVEHIELCDELPVNVFGYPLPSLLPSEFSLPWQSTRSQPAKPTKGAKRSKR